jgi:hypothetical protein
LAASGCGGAMEGSLDESLTHASELKS